MSISSLPHFLALIILFYGALFQPFSASAAPSAPSPDLDPSRGIKVWVLLKDKGPKESGARSPSPLPAKPLRYPADEDRPLHRPYLEALERRGFRLHAALKWQNRISGFIRPDRVEALRRMDFVSAVEPFAKRKRDPLGKRAQAAAPDYGATGRVFATLRIDEAHRLLALKGLQPGRGVRIAVIDNGFHLHNRLFGRLLRERRILDSVDFINPDRSSFFTAAFPLAGDHGAQTLSLIGGYGRGEFMGVAPEASFLLYRAENDTLGLGPEEYVEEDHVAAAIERAVEQGAQVISISLGYRYGFEDPEGRSLPDIPYAEINGRSRPASLAAIGAARRNVLVVAAAGNEAQNTTREDRTSPTLVSPADADSILAVGASDSSGRPCSFSSFGPTADGRRKPDIAAPGCPVPTVDPDESEGILPRTEGTSFSTPLVAGVAALLFGYRAGASAEEVRQAILKSGSRAQSPSDTLGHGMVDAAKALEILGFAPALSDRPIARTRRRAWVSGAALTFPRSFFGARDPKEIFDLQGRRVGRLTRDAITGDWIWANPEGREGIFFLPGLGASAASRP